MHPILRPDFIAGAVARATHRHRWAKAPAGVLLVLLQRTPAVTVATQAEYVIGTYAADSFKCLFALAALGAYNSVAGATTFGVTPGTPATGKAGTSFAIAGTSGTALSVAFTLTGAPGNPKSWSVTGTLPTGLTVTGGNPVNTSAPYKMTIAGTPSAAGNWTVTVNAWELANAAGNHASITCSFAIAGGVANVAPAITANPVSATVTVGGSATFTATATGTPTPTYQWFLGTTALSGQTGTSLSLTNVQGTDAGSYTMTATNAAGSATSAAATLTVNAAAVAPSITTQPAALTVTPGSGATFTVAAAGTGPLTYQWSKDNVAISGATSATYAIAAAASTDAGNYTVVVTNSAGSVTSAVASLTVNAAVTAPSITTQPQSAAVALGAPASFTVAAGGTAPLTYQWTKAGAAITGATSAAYSIAAAAVADAGNYSVTVTNSAGSVTSATGTLTVTDPVTSSGPVTLASTAQTVASGHSASISAVSSGAPGSTYQWQVSTDGGANWSAVTNGSTYNGANAQTLTITDATAAMSGYKYQLVVTSGGASVTSAALALTVIASPLPGPSGLAVNSSGNLVVADSSNNTVNVVTPAGVVTVLAGSAGQQGSSNGSGPGALFRQPGGLALDASGNIYVADTGNSLVRKITPAGVVTTLAGSASNQGYRDGMGTGAWFNSPADVAVDGAGNVYVADTGNSVIRKIAPDGTVTTVAGAPGVRGSADGVGSAARFNQPSGLAVDQAGNLYVADTFNQTIRRIAPDGTVSTWVGVPGISGSTDGTGANALFNLPDGISVDSAGNVYVADTGNASIRVISPGGAVVTLAGLSTVAGLQDGTGLEAWFNQPREVKPDGAGNLYVTDTGNAALRKIATGAVVTTLALSQADPPVASSGQTSGAASTASSGSTSSGGSTASSAVTGKAGAGSLDPWWSVVVVAMSVVALRRKRAAGLGRG